MRSPEMRTLLLFAGVLPAVLSAAGLGHRQQTRRQNLDDGSLLAGAQAGPSSDTTPRYAQLKLPRWLTEPVGLDRRATCVNGRNYCWQDPALFCGRCGNCCTGGKCAADFGDCCPDSAGSFCAYGFTCCAGAKASCCYAGTSFCCPSSENGCCRKGQTCGSSGCVGTATFVVQSITTTTTFYTTDFISATITTTLRTTFVQTSVLFVTSTVTSGGVDTATSTQYETSTRFTKRTVLELPEPTRPPASLGARVASARPEPPEAAALTASPMYPALAAAHDRLAAVGLLAKRAVTSYVYSYSFVWIGTTGTTAVMRTTVVGETDVVTSTSTIVNTVYSNAKTTVTVTSTIMLTLPSGTTISTIIDTTQGATPTPTDQVRAPDPTAGNTGFGSGAAGTGTPGGDGSSNGTVGTSGSTDSGGGGGNGGAGNGTSGSTDAAPPSSELSTGAKAGIGAGAAVAGLALIGAAFLLGRRLRNDSSSSSSSGGGNATPALGTSTAPTSPTPMSPAPMSTTTTTMPPYGTGSGGISTPSWTPPPPAAAAYPSPMRPEMDIPGDGGRWHSPGVAGAYGAMGARHPQAAAHARHYSEGVGGLDRAGGAASPSSVGSEIMTTGYTAPRRWTVEMEAGGGPLHGAGRAVPGPVYGLDRYAAEMPTGATPGYYREYAEMPGPMSPPPPGSDRRG